MIDRAALDVAVRDAEPQELFALAGELQGKAIVATRPTPPPPVEPPSAGDEDPLLTMPEVARRLGVSEAKAREMGRRREIPTVGVGRRVRVRRSALERWLRVNEAGGRG